MALLAALAAFVAMGALVVWLGNTLRNPVEARLSRLSPRQTRTSLEAPLTDRVFIPIFDGLVRAFVSVLPNRLVLQTNSQLQAAGSPITPVGFFTVVLVLGLVFPAALLFFLASSQDGISSSVLLMVIASSAIGSLIPFLWLRQRVRIRKSAILRSLADAFDLVTVCIEAGLGLDAALRQVAAKLHGPLADEIALTLRQVGIGRARREALEDMETRVDIPEVTTFVNAIIQAEQLGTSLGRVLRAQSVSLRIHRRQKAEELARKAPVKMVFPLVAFMMPTFFIVTIGPIAVHLIDYLKE